MKTKSFTLIELLVVIVIIGILAGVIIVSTSSSISKANFAKAQAFSNTVQQELLLNLVSEWTFDEGDAEDSWGNNDGTVNGATYKSKSDGVCVYGGCYSFNGTDDYIEIADNQELRMTQGGTIAAWIYPKSAGEDSGRIIDKSENTALKNGYGFYVTSNKNLGFGISSTRTYSSNNSIIYNQWQFVVVVFNSLGRKIYINGIDATGSGGSETVLPLNVAGVVRIGNSLSLSRTFDGLIDDVRVYNIALSTSQIKQHYVAGLNSLLAKGSISKEEYDQRLNNLALDF